MRPIEEQTILITGATSGLGRELAQALAKHGATLLLHGRDPQRGLETVRNIKEATGNERIQFCRAGLSSLREVEDLARQVRRLWEHPQLCRRMGMAGRQKVIREFTEEAYFHNLMAVYQSAIQRSKSDVGFIPVSSLGASRARTASASS